MLVDRHAGDVPCENCGDAHPVDVSCSANARECAPDVEALAAVRALVDAVLTEARAYHIDRAILTVALSRELPALLDAARREGGDERAEKIAQAIEALKASHGREGHYVDRYALTYARAARIAREVQP